MELALHDQWIDHSAAIFNEDVALDLNHHRFWVYFEDHGVGATGSGPVFGTKVVGGFQARFGAGLDRPTQGIGQHRQFAQANGLLGDISHPHLAVFEF